MALTGYLTTEFWGNTVSEYIIAIGILIGLIAILRIFKFIVLNRLRHITKKTRTNLDDLAVDVIESVNWFFYLIISLYVSLKWLYLPPQADRWVDYAFMVAAAVVAVFGAMHIIEFGKDKLIRKKSEQDESIIKFLSTLSKAVLWVIAFLLVLANMGVDITALIAGLGVGGIALAFALQNILEDLFSSVSIYFDKPFVKGDFIILENGFLGTVKKIGMKTTRIESLWGEEVVVSNRELTSAKIRNYMKMERRRIHFGFGVVYQTPVKKVKRIPKLVEDIFSKVEKADLDRVHFKQFGDSSLDFEVAYYVDTADYTEYMDKQQEINLAIMESFEKQGIEFAYPTRTIHLKGGQGVQP